MQFVEIEVAACNKNNACIDWSEVGELGYSKAYDKIKQYCN